MHEFGEIWVEPKEEAQKNVQRCKEIWDYALLYLISNNNYDNNFSIGASLIFYHKYIRLYTNIIQILKMVTFKVQKFKTSFA